LCILHTIPKVEHHQSQFQKFGEIRKCHLGLRIHAKEDDSHKELGHNQSNGWSKSDMQQHCNISNCKSLEVGSPMKQSIANGRDHTYECLLEVVLTEQYKAKKTVPVRLLHQPEFHEGDYGQPQHHHHLLLLLLQFLLLLLPLLHCEVQLRKHVYLEDEEV
jgi:hypothetical protein